MPNRIIKESIHESEKVNRMTDFQFRLWVNLIAYVDDYGRGDARPAIIKGKCFPLRERLTNADIDAALRALAGIGCVSLYEVDGRPYLCFPHWESHQRIRNKMSKFPAPQECESDCSDNHTVDSNFPQSAASCGETRLESNPIRIQNPNPNPNPNPKDARAREAFAAFWSAYPKKVGKPAAERAFKKVKEADYPLLLPAIEQHKRSKQWQKNDAEFIPNPSTWLNQERWNDTLPQGGVDFMDLV